MNIIDFLILGIVGGITPGPITALLLGETFKHGLKNGLKVPCALLFSNLVVAPLSIVFIFWGSQLDIFLKLMTYAGAAILIFMGIQELRSSGKINLKTALKPFSRTFLLDLINPHPYIIWFTVLSPQIVLQTDSLSTVVLFWASFVSGLIGTKVILVFVANQIKPWLKPSHMKIVTRFLALLLIFFGLKLLTT